VKELDRETVRQLLYNYLRNSDDVLNEDRTVQVLSQMLSEPTEMASGKTQALIKDILDEEIDQIQHGSVDEDGCLDRDSAVEYCMNSDWELDDFLTKVMERLEKAGKLLFKDTEMKTFLINPEKPLSSYRQVKEKVFANLSGSVWWLDKQFGWEGLMYLLELDPQKINDIKILSGPVNVDSRFKQRYIWARKELAGHSIDLQARVILSRSILEGIHDRYLADKNATYSVPPVRVLVDKLATFHQLPQEGSTQIQSEFNKYWHNSIDPLHGNNWALIQEARRNLKGEPGGGL
jgi:hypothetical protein